MLMSRVVGQQSTFTTQIHMRCGLNLLFRGVSPYPEFLLPHEIRSLPLCTSPRNRQNPQNPTWHERNLPSSRIQVPLTTIISPKDSVYCFVLQDDPLVDLISSRELLRPEYSMTSRPPKSSTILTPPTTSMLKQDTSTTVNATIANLEELQTDQVTKSTHLRKGLSPLTTLTPSQTDERPCQPCKPLV